MSCSSDCSRGRDDRRDDRRDNRWNVQLANAKFDSTFTRSDVAKFYPEFINGKHIEQTKSKSSIQLEEGYAYLISYSYHLEMEQDGSLEIIPTFNGDRLNGDRVRVTNSRKGDITAANTFIVEAESCGILSFRYSAYNEETGRRPSGQVSVVSLGQIDEEDKRRRRNRRDDSSDSDRGRERDRGRDRDRELWDIDSGPWDRDRD